MKTLEYAYAYGISLNTARNLTDIEKQGYREECRGNIIVSTGDSIELEMLTYADACNLIADHASRALYSFPGCANHAFEITDAEWGAIVELNRTKKEAARIAEEEELEKECVRIIEKAKTTSIRHSEGRLFTEAEAKQWRRKWNNANNEGEEGYIPEVITQEAFEYALQIVNK